MISRRTFFKGVGISVGSITSPQWATRIPESEASDGDPAPEEIMGNFVTFYQKIPDKPRERYAGVWESSKQIIDVAELVLSQVPTIDEIGDLENFVEPITGLLRNITENLETAYNIQIDTKYLDKAVRVAGYLPLLAQTWNILESSVAVLDIAATKQQFIQKVRHTETGKAAVKRFYIAVLLFFTELMFLWSGVGYRTAWKTTRGVANFGLVRLRERVGLRAYSVLLSIVHWLARGSFETTASYIIEKTGEVAQELSIRSIDFSRLSPKGISGALPNRSSASRFDFLINDYFSSTSLVGSAAEPIIDSSTKNVLIERYGGSGIIESKSVEPDTGGWTFW